MKKLLIVLFPAALLFCGCGKYSGKPSISGRPLYEYDYDGCIYISISGGGVVHSATCQNPKHTCPCD